MRSEASDQVLHRRREYSADAKERAKSDRLARLHPLPVTDGIPKRNHVFLAIPATLAHVANAASQPLKEFGIRDIHLVGHPLFFKCDAPK